ncbi:MAG: MFS transporter [Chloroflexi bacterium]|nr:MFS transporter [Chloroflexota bacterium]
MIEDKSQQAGQYKTGGGSALYILIICTLLYVINYIDRQVFSVVLQPMKIELGLTDTQCGLAQTIFILGMALFSFPVAFMVDRWSRSKTIGIMAMLWSLFTFLTGFAKSFTTLIIPRSLVGVGESGFTAGGVAMVSAAYPQEKRSRVLGIFNIGIPLGAAIGMIAGGAISAASGWRMAFFVFAIPGIILGILAFFMRDYKTAGPTGSATTRVNFGKSIVQLLRIRSLRWYYLGYGVLNFMSVGSLVWMPALTMRLMGISEAQAGLIVGGWGLTAIIAAPLGGWLADLWQKKTGRGRLLLPATATVIAAILLIIIVSIKLGPVGITLGFGYGVFLVIGAPALNSISQDVVPAAHKGLSMGMAVFSSYMLGGAWGPLTIGAISDALGGGAEGLMTALLITTIAGFLGAGCLFIASRTYPADMEKVRQETLMAR